MGKTDFFNRIRNIFGVDNPHGITEYCQKYWSNDVDHVLDTAQNACQNQFQFDFRWDMERTYEPVRFENDIDWILIPFGDREFLWQLNRHRFLLCLGQAYLMTGDESYAFHYARLLHDWIMRAQEGENIDLGPWRTLETGLRAEIWLRSLCMTEHSPHIGDELISLVETSMEKHADRLLEHFSEHKYISNWGVLESCGLLLFSLAERPDHPRKKLWEETAIKRLTLAANIQVLHDGTQWEQSPMYHNEVYQCFWSAFYYGKKASVPMPREIEEVIRKMAYVNGIWKKPDHTQFTQGDSDASDLRDQITAGAYLLQDPVLKYLGYERLDYENVWQFGYQACEAYLQIECKEPDFSSAQLPFSGNYYFRSNWGTDGSLLHFHCGDTGGGHGHADKLHVDLVLNGEDILIDSGRYTYVDGDVRYALKGPYAHNVTVVDHLPFSPCKDSWINQSLCTCLKQQYFEGKTGAFVEGSHTGYLSQGVLSSRRIIWIKPDIYVLADYFYATGYHTYESFYHFGRQGKLSLTGSHAAHFSGEQTDAFLQTVSGDGAHTIIESNQSCHYNEISQNQTLAVTNEWEGDFHRITVVNGGKKGIARPVSVTSLPVRSIVHDTEISPADTEAFRICSGESEYILLLCHREIMTPTDILKCENCIGYGKAVLFDRTNEKQEILSGETLAWF